MSLKHIFDRDISIADKHIFDRDISIADFWTSQLPTSVR